MRFLGVAALAAVAAMTVALGSVRATPDSTADLLNEVLTPPAGCSMPCWQGIQPNMTTVDEAVALLAALPAVREVRVTPNMISWWWNDDRPSVYAVTGRAFDGRMELALVNGQQRVTSIVLATTLEVGQLELTLGTPDSITLYTARPEGDRRGAGIVHLAHYGNIGAFSIFQCPLSVDQFWRGAVFLTFGAPNLQFNGDTYEVETLPGWFFRDQAPGCGSV